MPSDKLVLALSINANEADQRGASHEDLLKTSKELTDTPKQSKEIHDSLKQSKEVSPSPVLSREAGHTPKRSKETLSIVKRWKEISPRYSKESGTPKHSKESSSLLSHKKCSKEGEETRSSLQRKLKRFASLTAFKSQRTQADIREESFKSERKAEEKRSITPSRKRRLILCLRKKESQKIPVREVEAIVPVRLSDTNHAQCEIVDVQELQHKIKVRQKQLRMISDIMCSVSITAIVLSLIIALFGFSACYIAHIEYTVQKAAAMQMGKQWKSQCGRKRLQRMIYNNLYEETNCSLPSIEFAEWSPWSKCLKGRRMRWKIMQENQSYIFDKDFYEEQIC